MEGGGNKGNGRTALRQGMDAFLDPLKEAARAKEIHWKLICCGSRNEAFRGFRNALRNGDDGIVVLLVDSEGLVQGAPRAHLHARDRWELTGVEDTAVHLMVQTMETWIVADMDTLSGYYGQRFNQRALPRATDGGCSVAVRHALRQVDGVVAAEVSYDDKRADVRYRPALVTPESLVMAIDRIGFQASVLEPPAVASDEAG